MENIRCVEDVEKYYSEEIKGFVENYFAEGYDCGCRCATPEWVFPYTEVKEKVMGAFLAGFNHGEHSAVISKLQQLVEMGVKL